MIDRMGKSDNGDFAVLRGVLANAEALGHEYVILTAVKATSPKNWTRCRVISGKPSLMGRCVGVSAWRRYVFDVRADELRAFLAAHGELNA